MACRGVFQSGASCELCSTISHTFGSSNQLRDVDVDCHRSRLEQVRGIPDVLQQPRVGFCASVQYGAPQHTWRSCLLYHDDVVPNGVNVVVAPAQALAGFQQFTLLVTCQVSARHVAETFSVPTRHVAFPILHVVGSRLNATTFWPLNEESFARATHHVRIVQRQRYEHGGRQKSARGQADDNQARLGDGRGCCLSVCIFQMLRNGLTSSANDVILERLWQQRESHDAESHPHSTDVVMRASPVRLWWFRADTGKGQVEVKLLLSMQIQAVLNCIRGRSWQWFNKQFAALCTTLVRPSAEDSSGQTWFWSWLIYHQLLRY